MRKRKKKGFPRLDENPWYKKAWVLVSAVGFVFFTLVINAPSLFANLENIPADTTRIKNKFLSWYYDDDDWTGFWSSFPEGYADIGDMNLSDVDLRLETNSVNGQIGGMIVNKKICAAVPLSGVLLVEGAVSGDVASITGYDIVNGKRRNLLKAKLERQGIVMTVLPTEGNLDWLSKASTIGRHWSPDGIETDNFGDFCKEEREAVFLLLRKHNPSDRTRRPASEY